MESASRCTYILYEPDKNEDERWFLGLRFLGHSSKALPTQPTSARPTWQVLNPMEIQTSNTDTMVAR